MIKKKTTFAKSMPVPTSVRILLIRLGTLHFLYPPLILQSSTSSDVCQKNKYGVIVVPKTATIAKIYSLLKKTFGTIDCLKTASQSGWTIKPVMMYATTEIVSHFKNFA